jgi:glycosyltransferase involved in cell wall biosynthesis
MDLTNLSIGYVALSQNYEQPGDKRRFVHYARSRNLTFEIADPSKKYDLVVLSQNADLSVWCGYDIGGAKIVYDFIDSYLAIPKNELKGSLRGLAKFILGKSKYLRLNQRKAIESMCLRSDAVICSTAEQAKDIKPFCNNVHQILDIHSSLHNRTKTDYASSKVFNIVWEGMADNIYQFNFLKSVFKELEKRHEIALHFVTDLSFFKYSRRFGKTYTKELIEGLCKRVFLYEWNDIMASEIICSSDLAIIPVDLKNPLVRGKPENKLLLFWRMGVPVITSATPAYERTMKKANLNMTCSHEKEWIEKIEEYIFSQESRHIAGSAGREIANKEYSEDKTLKQWDEAFQSIIK